MLPRLLIYLIILTAAGLQQPEKTICWRNNNAMMNKDALRKVLEKLPDTEAVALAEAETAPGALKTLRRLSDSNQILAFLLTFTPVEVVGILNHLEPTTARSLYDEIKQQAVTCVKEPGELVEIIRLCDLLAVGAWQDKA
jgi:Mg/Co/Ni transporter MgtE